MDQDLIANLHSYELVIPAWQMVFYVIVISFCLLSTQYKVGLILTYSFSLYWGFVLYWGEVVGSFSRYPGAVILYIVSGLLVVILMIIACLRGY
jgi:hypothetical protein